MTPPPGSGRPGVSASQTEPIERVLPEAQEAVKPVNANRVAFARTNLKWIGIIVLILVVGGISVGSGLFGDGAGKAEKPAHYTATDAAALPGIKTTPLDEAEKKQRDLQTQLTDATTRQNNLSQIIADKDAQIASLQRGAPPNTGTRAAAVGASVVANGDGSLVGGAPGQNGASPTSRYSVRNAPALGPDASYAPSRITAAMVRRGAGLPPAEETQAQPPPTVSERSLSTIVATGPESSAEAQPTRAGVPGPSSQAGYGLNKPPTGTGSGAGASKSVTSNVEVYDSAHYVPPNAYVEATVLVGVDAAAGTSYSADPKPVLFRIHGKAVHVGPDGKHQTTDLDGCEVNGAAFAELPSEKVYIKLQKITCPAGPGRFSVATVEGYVASRGKAGVRGRVISREGQFTAKAFVAGALNGLGQAMSVNVQRTQALVGAAGASGGTVTAPQLSASQIAQGSAGTGISTAASTLANYYIQRAEQYQPVIEMPTGITTTLVFLNGFQIR